MGTRLVVISFLAALALTGAVQWEPRTPMPTNRSDFAAVLSGNRIFVIGGCGGDQYYPDDSPYSVCPFLTGKVEAYLPEGDTWDSDYPEMPVKRYRFAAVAVGDRIFVIGGLTEPIETPVARIDVLNVTSREWSEYQLSLPVERSDLAAFAVGTKIYVVGGYDREYRALPSVLVHDTANPEGAWTVMHNVLHTARGDLCAVTDADDDSTAQAKKAYIFGGFNEANWCEALSDLEEFDIAAGTWKDLELHPDSPDQEEDAKAGDLACDYADGLLWLLGGERTNASVNCDPHSIPIHHVHTYDPATNQLKERIPLPDARFRFAAQAYKGYIYVFGGQMPGEQVHRVTNTVWALDGAAAVASAATSLFPSMITAALTGAATAVALLFAVLL